MTETAQPEAEQQGFEVIPHDDHLSRKCLRPGDARQAAAAAIQQAEEAIGQLSIHFDGWMEQEAARLAKARDMTLQTSMGAEALDELFQVAHDLKGQASTLGYPLAADICASLCRLIDRAPVPAELPGDLLSHHVDAVRAIARDHATGIENAKASALTEKLREVTEDYLAQIRSRVEAAEANAA
ncbi:MAG: Hpt domain-containing protein [Pseudomonadota bacterium]|nr:Hpt domain-containing protein [Pseudomonadota bacterium]